MKGTCSCQTCDNKDKKDVEIFDFIVDKKAYKLCEVCIAQINKFCSKFLGEAKPVAPTVGHVPSHPFSTEHQEVWPQWVSTDNTSGWSYAQPSVGSAFRTEVQADWSAIDEVASWRQAPTLELQVRDIIQTVCDAYVGYPDRRELRERIIYDVMSEVYRLSSSAEVWAIANRLLDQYFAEQERTRRGSYYTSYTTQPQPITMEDLDRAYRVVVGEDDGDQEPENNSSNSSSSSSYDRDERISFNPVQESIRPRDNPFISTSSTSGSQARDRERRDPPG